MSLATSTNDCIRDGKNVSNESITKDNDFKER